MNRTHVGNFKEPAFLLGSKSTVERYLSFDAIDLTFLGLTISAVSRMDSGMSQSYTYLWHRPALAPRVKPNRHRSAGAERGQQQIVWGRTFVGAAEGPWLIRDKAMSPGNNLLLESGAITMDDYCLVGNFTEIRITIHLEAKFVSFRGYFQSLSLSWTLLPSRCQPLQR